MHKIKNMRKTGLARVGEFGVENLVFKMLRNKGDVDKLQKARAEEKSKELSLKERVRKPMTYGFGDEQLDEVELTPDGVSPGTHMFCEKESDDKNILEDFLEFCTIQLELEKEINLKIRRDPEWSVRNKTFGRYNDATNELEIGTGGRHIMDVLRTLAHELVHQKQNERESVPIDAGEDGSPYENEANAQAGILMRKYGKLHPELFMGHELTEAVGYIPTAAEANDPRFKMALTVDVHPGALGKAANAFLLNTDSQGHPQELRPDGLVNRMMTEYLEFKK
jgi:hypothetical protein